MFDGPFSRGVVARALEKGLVKLSAHDIRDHVDDKRRTVDDYPFGGGSGMVMMPSPYFEAVNAIRSNGDMDDDVPVILLTPQGDTLTQEKVKEFSMHKELIMLCGRYEGVDERVREHLITDEISIGDYVLSGGEIPAMVLIEAISRMVLGVVGSTESIQNDSFTMGLLQHPQYTRPSNYNGLLVPDILLSGNHSEIDRWRRQQSLRRTFESRPALLDTAFLTEEDQDFLENLRK